MVFSGRTRCGLILALSVGILPSSHATAAMASEPPGLSRDFDAAVARIKAEAQLSPSGPLGLDEYKSEAETIARKYGPAASSPLGDRLGASDRATEVLALMTLASLSSDPAAAAELSSRLGRRDFGDSVVRMALTYATPSTAMAIVDEVMSRRFREPGVLVSMSTVSRFYGEPGRDAMLEALFKDAIAQHVPLPEHARREISANLVALRQRLAQPAEQRLGWSAQDLAVWRAVKTMPNFRGLTMSISNRASLLGTTMRFTPSFLKERLAASSIDFVERRLLVQLAHNQPQARMPETNP